MARTKTSQVGQAEIGDCAECGAVVSFTLTHKDYELYEETNRWQRPLCVWRDCPECGHEDASVLI
jgi:hypothetical protein